MDSLRQKLNNQGLKDVVYMVINQQEAQARLLHTVLASRLSEHIILYKQDGQQPDVWQKLSGEKDDFFIYDRCGRLTHRISLPYSIIGQGHMEQAIKDTYCNRICGECTHESTEILQECIPKTDVQPNGEAVPPAEEDTGHGGTHGCHHGHGHHGHGHRGHGQHGHGHHGHGHHGHGQHGHGHHGQGDNICLHHRGVGHGHDHNHGHDGHGSDRGHVQDSDIPQRQHPIDLGQIQQVVNIHQLPQLADVANVRP